MVSTHLRNLAECLQRAATARIGSAQRRNRAESAKHIAAELGGSSFAKEATSAALLASMVALAWNANKLANQRRLRADNRRMAELMEFHPSAGVLPQSSVDPRDYDAECERTYDEANRLRAQALDVARKLRQMAQQEEAR